MREAIGHKLECERCLASARLTFHQVEMTYRQSTA